MWVRIAESFRRQRSKVKAKCTYGFCGACSYLDGVAPRLTLIIQSVVDSFHKAQRAQAHCSVSPLYLQPTALIPASTCQTSRRPVKINHGIIASPVTLNRFGAAAVYLFGNWDSDEPPSGYHRDVFPRDSGRVYRCHRLTDLLACGIY